MVRGTTHNIKSEAFGAVTALRGVQIACSSRQISVRNIYIPIVATIALVSDSQGYPIKHSDKSPAPRWHVRMLLVYDAKVGTKDWMPIWAKTDNGRGMLNHRQEM